jgi:hypothetical protein
MEINKQSQEKEIEATAVGSILKLLELGTNNVLWLFCDQFKETYAAIYGDGSEIMPLDSQNFQQWLFNYIYEQTGKSIADNNLRAVTKILKHNASPLTYSLSVRIARKDEAIFYDLGSNQIVLTNLNGWRLISTQTQILFRRFNHQKKQDLPIAGGYIDDLLKLINLAEKKDEILLKVYLVAAFIPDFPHPVLVVQGPQGSAKSTLCRLIKDLIDPSNLESTSFGDKNIKEFVQTASHHWLLVLDNLSSISNEFSDVISRVCTGGGLSKRMLYRNDDDFIYNFKHLIALNGITQVVYKPDLLDRSLIIQLERITEEARMTEDQLWKNYRNLKSGILGAIFDTVSGALREYSSVEIRQLPRMADFVKWGCAIAKALGYTQDEFLAAYAENTEIQTEAAVDANPIATAVVEFMRERIEDYYTDTPANFYKALSRIAQNLSLQDSPGWPKAANALTKKIPEFQPVLQSLGLKIIASRSKIRSITSFSGKFSRHWRQ